MLGHDDEVSLLEQTLEEEKQTDKRLTELAESTVNVEALETARHGQETGARGRMS
jgi:ferritin-like metal-binding protein YciE